MCPPGFTASASPAPTQAAKTEQRKYQPMTLLPMRPNRLRGRLAAPLKREKKITGMTTILSMLTNTLPKGEIQGKAFAVTGMPVRSVMTQRLIPMAEPRRNPAPEAYRQSSRDP